MRACWMYEARDRPCFWQLVDYLKDLTNNETFNERSFVYNDPSVKRVEGVYEFERDWPSNGSENDESEEEDYTEEQPFEHKFSTADKDSKDKFKIEMDKPPHTECAYVKTHNGHMEDYTDSCSVSNSK